MDDGYTFDVALCCQLRSSCVSLIGAKYGYGYPLLLKLFQPNKLLVIKSLKTKQKKNIMGMMRFQLNY